MLFLKVINSSLDNHYKNAHLLNCLEKRVNYTTLNSEVGLKKACHKVERYMQNKRDRNKNSWKKISALSIFHASCMLRGLQKALLDLEK